MNKAVIFDLDGTLIDSVPDIADCVNTVLSRHGYPLHSEREYCGFVGNGARKLIERSLPENSSEEIIDFLLKEYNNLYTNCGSPKTRLFDGVEKTLNELKKRGFYLGIVTNKPQQTTDEVVKIYLREIGFDTIIGQKKDVKCKPDPTAVLDVLNKLSVLPKNAYMVGDGETDYQLSVNAGMCSVSALWGYRTKEQLKSVGATVFADSITDILSLINI